MSVRRAIANFAFAGLVGVTAVTLFAGATLDRAGARQAQANAREQTTLAGRGIVEPALRDDLVTGNPATISSLDLLINERILNARVVRVKLWDATGRIVYSDLSQLIGQRFTLGSDERVALKDDSVFVEKSDLNRPESALERGNGALYSVYLRIRTPNGTPLLYEEYLRASALTDESRSFQRSFLVPALVALALVWLLQLPLAFRLAKQVVRARRNQEIALEQAINASERERRRIAADLHDGVVQDLLGLSYRLTGAAQRSTNNPQALENAAADTRAAVRRLRTTLVDINPKNLEAIGLRRAVEDLVSPLEARGVNVRIQFNSELTSMSSSTQSVLFGAIRESVRNVDEHADANELFVDVIQDREAVRVIVQDNGQGFDEVDRQRRHNEGHLGLELHERLLEQIGGRFCVRSSKGQGTTVECEVPLIGASA